MSVSPWEFLEAVLDGQLHPGQLKTTEALLNAASFEKGSVVLDVGCGTGSTVELVENRGAHAIGLDKRPASKQMVQGDFNAIPFGKDSFDVVVSECVLCLSPRLEQTFNEIHRVLKPAGRLAFSDLVIEGSLPQLPGIIEECLCLQGTRNQDYVCNEISESGFEIREVQSHQEDLIALRDTFKSKFDLERICDMLGDDSGSIRAGIVELDDAIETGDVRYISVVADNPGR